MLYEAERHEPLTASAWNEQTARAGINEILDAAADKFSARDVWPSHPHDTFSPNAQWNLYNGAAGTIWAQRHERRKPDSLPDFSSVVPRLLEPNRNWILNVKGVVSYGQQLIWNHYAKCFRRFSHDEDQCRTTIETSTLLMPTRRRFQSRRPLDILSTLLTRTGHLTIPIELTAHTSTNGRLR